MVHEILRKTVNKQTVHIILEFFLGRSLHVGILCITLDLLIFWWGNINPFRGVTPLGFWWCLPWVWNPGWIPRLYDSSLVRNGFLKFTSSATLADNQHYKWIFLIHKLEHVQALMILELGIQYAGQCALWLSESLWLGRCGSLLFRISICFAVTQ